MGSAASKTNDRWNTPPKTVLEAPLFPLPPTRSEARLLPDLVGPGAFRLLADDRIGLAVDQNADGALIRRRVQVAGLRPALKQLGDLADHLLLVLLGLGARCIVVQHDGDRLVLMLDRVVPTLHRRFHEAGQLIDHLR